MNKKKKEEPVVMDKPWHVEWPGFQGPMTWGQTFVMKWADNHPDSHCEQRKYTPDHDGICECGWVPADKICCDLCNETVRLKIEKSHLRRMFEKFQYNFGNNRVLEGPYLGYCDEFRDSLTGTPDLKAVLKWFQSKKLSEQHKILFIKFRPKRRVIKIEIRSNIDLSGMFDDIFEDLLSDAPNRVIEEILNSDDLPEEIKAEIREYLNQRDKK